MQTVSETSSPGSPTSSSYGYFDAEHGEYVITRPDTPQPWSNYLGSADFGGIITNNAAGYTFYKSASQGRLSRFPFNVAPSQWPGRFVYLRDQADGDFWSASWLPVAKPLADFKCECRHGTGTTKMQSTYRQIHCEVTYYVPLGETFEVWEISVKNLGTEPRRLQVFPYLEPQCNWSAEDDTRNLQYNQYIAQGRWIDGRIDLVSNGNMPEDSGNFTNKDQKRHTFFALVGAEANGFDTERRSFLGPHGTYGAPEALRCGQCRQSLAYGDMPCMAYQIDWELAPGETKTFSTLFGVGAADTAGQRATDLVRSRGKELLSEIRNHWQDRLKTLHVQTPDPDFDAMANLWSPYNNLMTFYWSRTASLVYAGERDGLGFRDSLQDLVGTAALIPHETRQRLELLLTGQFSSGGCKPVIQPFHHHPGHEVAPQHYRSDDALWFFNAVPTFLKETGDMEWCRQVLPFADSGSGTVIQHLRRALEFNLARTGAHGLPCGLDADWNDCLRLGEKGESVFVALQLRLGLREYAELCERLSEPAESAWARQQMVLLDERISEHAWDGEWYLRAYRFDGLPFGSHRSPEGRIFMNPQAWAVLSGTGPRERALRAMEAMHEQLSTEYGMMLCAPPFVETDPEVCLARLFNPGTKENGGIFNHTQGWAVLAAAQLGLGNRAYEYLHNVLPARFNSMADVREVEPYVVCQSTHSRFSPHFGKGRVSWLSGSAVWNYVAMTSGILGIQPDYDGLRVDPCIPSSWPGFQVVRFFRGAEYRIEVANPQGAEKGVVEVLVDGRALKGNLLPVAPEGTVMEVKVTLGHPAP